MKRYTKQIWIGPDIRTIYGISFENYKLESFSNNFLELEKELMEYIWKLK